MKKDESLAVVDVNAKEIGPKLIEMARDKERQAMQDAVVNGIRAIMADVTKHQNVIKVSKERIEKQEKRLKALNSGEFTVKYSVDLGGLQVIFTDESLQAERGL